MDAILDLFDTNAKRWLAVLVASVLISIVFLERAFLNAVTPQENVVTAGSATSGESEDTQSKSGSGSQTQESMTFVRVSPFDNQSPKTVPKDDPVVHQQIVHQEAEYLRQLIAAGKLPKGFGNLTKEQVDDMEKRGVTIN